MSMFNQEQLAAIAVAWHMLQQQEQQQQQQGLVNHRGHLQQSDLNIAPSPPLQPPQPSPPHLPPNQQPQLQPHHLQQDLRQQHDLADQHLRQLQATLQSYHRPHLQNSDSMNITSLLAHQGIVDHNRAIMEQLESCMPSPPLLQQQQQQQQQQHQQQQQTAPVNHYQAQLHQSDQLDIVTSTQQQQQLRPQLQQMQQQPQQPQQPQQQVLTSKPRKPESYSAIVAKFNNSTSTNTSNNNSNSISNSISTNNNNNINSNSNINNLTGNGLGQSNGSLLNHHQSNLLALEPTINYANDHSTSPAQQLFQHSQNLYQPHTQPIQPQNFNHSTNHHIINPSLSNNNTPSLGSATNLLGFMGLYVGNLSPDLTKEQLEKIFSKYGEPVKAHRLIRSPVAFIKYENTESPRAAIDDLYGILLPEFTLNQDQPLKLHFDRNDAQLKANYRPTELPPKADNGECYGWRTTVCRRGKNCPKKHIPINRGIDFQMWMIKSTPTTTTTTS